MAVNPSALGGPKPQFELSDGTPAVGCRLFFYVAGSVGTKQNTYTDSTGGSANTNPVVLNALGMPTTEIWWTAGQSYKVVYAPPGSDDPPNSPIFTVDHLSGINDTTASLDQWVAGPTPTFISATSFSLVGDQTGTFHVGRRVRTINTGGTIYSTITASAFAAVTTVTVANDSGVLDSGLSAVSYGLISFVNTSRPTNGEYRSVQVYTATGANTWTKPAGLKRVKVTVVGAGGGGGGAAGGANTSAGGGGAGGTSIKTVATASLGATEAATIGAGGAGGSNAPTSGTGGGTTSFGAHATATGGTGGTGAGAGTWQAPGTAGAGASGDINMSGGQGSRGAPGAGGSGGVSFMGGGGSGTIDAVGGAGQAYGSGGGGAGSVGGAGASGGAGKDGIVIVEEFF